MSLSKDFIAKREMELGFSMIRDGATTWLADVYLDGKLLFQNLYAKGGTEEEAARELLSRMKIKPNS